MELEQFCYYLEIEVFRDLYFFILWNMRYKEDKRKPDSQLNFFILFFHILDLLRKNFNDLGMSRTLLNPKSIWIHLDESILVS